MDVAYNPSVVKNEVRDLERYWPSFNPKVSDEDLWQEEVQRHGSCAICQGDLANDTISYLSNTLQIYSWLDAHLDFIHGNIRPSYKKPIALHRLYMAFHNTSANVRPELHCEGKRHNLDILREVKFCLRNGNTVSGRCPLPIKDTCQTGDIWYLGNGSPSA